MRMGVDLLHSLDSAGDSGSSGRGIEALRVLLYVEIAILSQHNAKVSRILISECLTDQGEHDIIVL